MKKVWLCLTAFLFGVLLCTPIKAEACLAPLQESGGSVMLIDCQDVSMQYCRIEIRPTLSYFAVTADFAIQNSGGAQTITVGIPVAFGSVAASSRPTVYYQGNSLSVSQVSAVKNNSLPASQLYYSNYYTWTVEIDAGETAFMYCNFTVDASKYNNETQRIDIPMKILEYWAGDVGSAEIIADSAALNIYSYDRNPVITPSEVYETGRLVWHLGAEASEQNFVMYHNIDDQTISKYFRNVYTSGVEAEVANMFRLRQYDKIIDIIESDLSSSDDFLFMKMVCHEKLGETSEAQAMFDSLYGKQLCFSANSEVDISEYVYKRMLYQRYASLKESGSSADVLYSVLNQGIQSLTNSRSQVFLMWAEQELDQLEPLLTDENLVVADPNATPMPDSNNLVENTKFVIFGHQIDAGVLFIAIIVFVIIAVFVVATRPSRRNRR